MLLASAALVAAALPAAAQNATWNSVATVPGPVPGTFNFDAAANWTPAAQPTGTAFFGVSTTPNISFSDSSTTIGGWTFNAGASNYNFINSSGGSRFLNFTGAGIVINGGSATINNHNLLNFFNTSTAGSATITNDGFVNFFNTSTAGSATITIITGALGFGDSSSAGSATINNTGSMSFVQTSTAGSATITNGHFLDFFGSSSAGSATITNTAFMDFFDASTAGSATITSSTILRFSNTSTAGSATITNNSALGFQDSSSAGSATITNNGPLRFVGTSTGGTARFINGAAGNIDLSGLTSAGMTAGSIEGAGTIGLGSKNLAAGGNNLSTTFSGVLQDGGGSGGTGGSLTKAGAGTLTLTGVNSYTGATTIDAGRLMVNGSIATSILTTVNNGGTLGGAGTVGATQVNSGGVFAPGTGAPGTSMTVAGSLAFQSGAFYLVQVSPSAASFAGATGAASLAGTVQAAFAPGSYVVRSYDILHATGGLGGSTFDGLSGNVPAGFAAGLSYTPTDVFLNLTAALGAGAGLNQNQQNVANAINGFFNNGGALPPGFASLFGLSRGGLANGLTQLSGETATGSQQTTFNAMGLFLGLLTDPFVAGRGDGPSVGGGGVTGYTDADALGYAAKRAPNDARAAIYTKAPPRLPAFEQRWSIWAAGFGGSQATDGNTVLGSNNTNSQVFGVAAGADYRLSPSTLAGFALAGGGTNFSVANGGTGRSDLFQAGAFVRHTVGPAYLSAAAAYGWQDITTDRTLTIVGIDRLRAQFNANAWSGRLEGGYRFVTPWIGGIGITPYAAVQATTFDLPAYAEGVVSGANTFALGYGAKSVTDTRSEFGLRADKSFALTDAILTLRGRAAWAHDFNPDRNIAATFQILPGASFVVNGARQAPDSALTTASVEIKWLNRWSAAVMFEGEFSEVTRSYAGKGVLRYMW